MRDERRESRTRAETKDERRGETKAEKMIRNADKIKHDKRKEGI